jgi:hypothetical protein
VAAVQHAHRPHHLHPHLPHPHVEPEFDKHPWRMVPVALGMIVLLVATLIAICFELAKAFTGHAY